MKLRVLQYNLLCRPPPLHNVKHDFRTDRLKVFARAAIAGAYDIVCCQELFHPGNHKKIDQLANELSRGGLRYQYRGPESLAAHDIARFMWVK
ncbi:hypothetical protein KIPB_009293, partial [Kipferlia bialata]|eukprot:g9293.t1